MDYEYEIKRLRRLNLKIYMTMANIINVLNERESEELLMKNLNNIKREIIIDEEMNQGYKEELIINELKEKVNYLMLRQKEREERMKKYFTYDSSNSDCESDSDECGCGKEPHKQCQEIEDYINSINN